MQKYYYKLIIGDNWAHNYLTPEAVVNAVKIQYGIDEMMEKPIKELLMENHHGIDDWCKNLKENGPDWEISAGNFEVKAIKWEGWKVNLTYYKESGKYYSSGEYVSTEWELFAIFNDVAALMRTRQLPHLVEGHSDFYATIDVPEHPYNHPHLFLPQQVDKYKYMKNTSIYLLITLGVALFLMEAGLVLLFLKQLV